MLPPQLASPQDESAWTEDEARLAICEIGRRLWQKDMVDANGGNLSLRLGGDRVLATPTTISKGFMQPDDLVILDLEGNQISGKRKSTSEILMHLVIYRERPNVRSVAHAHPRHATAMALAGRVPPQGLLPEVELLIGEIGLAPYRLPGSHEFAEALIPYIRNHSAILLGNHGAVAMGRGLLEAYWKLEVLESACAMYHLAEQMGGAHAIGPEGIQEIRSLRANFGLE